MSMCRPPIRRFCLKVRFASVDRSLDQAARHQYLQYRRGQYDRRRHDRTVFSAVCNPPPSGGYADDQRRLSNALNLFFFRPDLNLGATIQALETSGLVQVLAEPNVLAENGKQASFLAGGEYPYPVVQGSSGAGCRSGHDPVQGIWHSPELHPHHHSPRHDPAPGRPRSQLAGLHQWRDRSPDSPFPASTSAE